MTLAPIAKAIIAAHYGRKPDFSYMFGCSNGGRHTMVAATRMPEAYDGFLVGDPGLRPAARGDPARLGRAGLRQGRSRHPQIDQADDAALVSRKIVAACDKLDGLEDGLTANLAACQKAFDFDSLLCAEGASADCLPKAKVEALKMSFAGPKNSKGEALYSDWPVDGGVGTGNWRLWKIESPIPPWDHYPIIATMGAASLEYIFTTPPTPVAGSTDALMKSLLAFDFDGDAPKIYAKTDAFPQSAMEFMTPPDADDPKLAQFRQLGRKMIIYHGQADPVFSIDDTIRWYDKLNANLDGKAEAEVRLFAVPGMTHCSDGLALDKFDALTALIDWVEKGKAPDRIIATVDPANKEIPASWSPTRTRPLCAWPNYARYKSGDPESADSFECARAVSDSTLEVGLHKHPGYKVVSGGVGRADRPVRFAKSVHLRRPFRIVWHREISLTQSGRDAVRFHEVERFTGARQRRHRTNGSGTRRQPVLRRLEHASPFEVLETEPLEIGGVARPEPCAMNADPGILGGHPLAPCGEDSGAGARAIMLGAQQCRLAELLEFAGDLQRPFRVAAKRVEIDDPDGRDPGGLILDVVVDMGIDPPLDDEGVALDVGRDDAAGCG